MKTMFRYLTALASAFILFSACQGEETKPEVSISFSKTQFEMTMGDEALDLVPHLKIENSEAAPSFKSSDTKVATVSNSGKVTAVAPGSTDITASVEGKSTTCKVVVKAVTAGNITLSCETTTLETGVEATIKAACEAEGYDYANLEWSCTSTPENIFSLTSVNEKEYKFKFTEYQENATAKVIVKDKLSNASAEITFTIQAEMKVEVVRITLNHTQLFVRMGDEPVQLVATCYDQDNNIVEGYNALDWSASTEDGNVVEISSDGLLTFRRVGTTTVTVKNRSNGAVNASCNVTVSEAEAVVEEIILSPSAKTIKPGEKFTISTLITPENAVDKTLTFVSSNDKVATVTSNGEVEGIAEGEAEITVSASNGVKAICKVTVSESGTGGSDDAPAVESISLDTEDKSYKVPQLETKKVIAYYGPAGAAPKTTSWKSSDETLATVDSEGNVTAVAEKINEEEEVWVDITHIADNETATISLQIVRAVPKTLTITAEPEGKKIYMGESFTYTAKIEPDLANQEVIWGLYDSNGEHIMAGMGYNSGEFKTGITTTAGITIGVGKYKISAKASANQNLVQYTEIEVLPVEIVSASLNNTELDLNVGATAYLQVSFNPANVTFKDVEWKSSDEAVATVGNDGKVTAVSAGTADITATLSNGETLTCKVTVTSDESAAKVGDYYYSDGTWSTELDSTKECVGIVFSVDNVTLHDKTLAAAHPECTHGIVVSIKETSKVKWQGWRSDINTWAVNNGYMPLSGVECPSGTSNFYLTDNGKKLCGYNNTAAIEAYKKSAEYANGDDNVKIYLLDNMSSMTDVDNTSGWYVPSVAELNMIAANYSLIDSKSKSAGGDAIAIGYGISHWSSTEGKNNDTAVKIRLDNSTITYNEQKNKEYNVRYVFAF